MVSILSLWLPILLSAVAVFVASSVIHMVLPWHKGDAKKVPAEAEAMDALRKLSIPPGDYVMPRAGSSAEMKEPAFIEKMKQGPVVFMTVMPSGPFNMGGSLAQWFLYCVVVGVFAAYIAGHALSAGAPYLAVHRFAGCTAFVGYSLALWQGAIWYKRSPVATLKTTIDGLVYALLTGGVFGWLWPDA